MPETVVQGSTYSVGWVEWTERPRPCCCCWWWWRF